MGENALGESCSTQEQMTDTHDILSGDLKRIDHIKT